MFGFVMRIIENVHEETQFYYYTYHLLSMKLSQNSLSCKKSIHLIETFGFHKDKIDEMIKIVQNFKNLVVMNLV